MELTAGDLTDARKGQHVRIQAEGDTFYLLSQQVYERLEQVDYAVMTKQEMDLLADEADAIISAGENG